jgi:hypothetical protein
MEQTLTYWELHELALSLNSRISKFAHRGMMKDAEDCIQLKKKILSIMENTPNK